MTKTPRLVENGLPVDSLARLLGHSQLQTTQRYIAGADPTLRADFTAAMTRLEATLVSDQRVRHTPLPQPPPTAQPRTASPQALAQLRPRLDTLPPRLVEGVAAFLAWHWPTWRAQTAYHSGENLISLVRRIFAWLMAHRQVDRWEGLQRADLEAWLTAHGQDGVSVVTIVTELAQLRSLLTFLQRREYALDPGLFRIRPPKLPSETVPRYLSEAAYRRLEAQVLQAAPPDGERACFDRAWFLTLAHKGLRLSELLDLRLEDLNLAAGCAVVRGGKPGRDRIVFLTPVLSDALQAYLDRRPQLADNDHVFVFRGGRSPTVRTIQQRLACYGQQVGVHVSPHRLRHTLATRLINQGMPIQALRRLLGHERLQTTLSYARVYDETVYRQFSEAMARLEALPVAGWPGTEPRPVDTSAPRDVTLLNSM